MDVQQNRPKTALVLERWRQHKRLSKQKLADTCDVSGTYVRYIEAGFDDDGRMVIPSAKVIQQLARGLGDGDPAVEQRAYEELMVAAGYLDGAAVHTRAPSYQVAPPHAAPDVSLPAVAPHWGAPTPPARLPNQAGQVLIALRDRRLQHHCRELLENWEALTSEDQAALLSFMEFIAERRRRNEGPR